MTVHSCSKTDDYSPRPSSLIKMTFQLSSRSYTLRHNAYHETFDLKESPILFLSTVHFGTESDLTSSKPWLNIIRNVLVLWHVAFFEKKNQTTSGFIIIKFRRGNQESDSKPPHI